MWGTLWQGRSPKWNYSRPSSRSSSGSQRTRVTFLMTSWLLLKNIRGMLPLWKTPKSQMLVDPMLAKSRVKTSLFSYLCNTNASQLKYYQTWKRTSSPVSQQGRILRSNVFYAATARPGSSGAGPSWCISTVRGRMWSMNDKKTACQIKPKIIWISRFCIIASSIHIQGHTKICQTYKEVDLAVGA